MLSRTITRRAVRLNTPPSARSLARNYSVMTPSRMSPVALSKRPMKPLSVSPMRQFSWTPWRAPSSDTPDSAPASTSTSESVQSLATQSTPSHEHLFSESSTCAASSSSTVESTSSSIDSSASLVDAATTVDPILPLHANGQTLGELIVNTPLPLADILQSPAAIEAVCTKADLGLIGLTHSWYSLPGWAVDGMVALHNMTGAPWWATIGMMTVLIRLCLFPVFLKAHGNNARFQAIQPEFTELAKKITDAKKKNDSLEMQQYTASLQELLKVHKTNPAKALLLPLSQLPVFLTMFSAVRWMAETPIPQMKEGGFSFFTDLTASDPTYILPITSMVLTNIVLRTGADGMGGATGTENGKHMINAFTMFSVLGAVFASRFPAALLVYWTCTSFMTLCQAVLMRRTWFKRLFNVHDPVKLPPPPGTKPVGKITLLDTIKAGINKYKATVEEARTKQRVALAAFEDEERQKGLRKGTGRMISEKIKDVPSHINGGGSGSGHRSRGSASGARSSKEGASFLEGAKRK